MNTKELITYIIENAPAYGIETSVTQIMNMFYDSNKASWNSAINASAEIPDKHIEQNKIKALLK